MEACPASSSSPSPAERFWSLAEAAERGALVDRSHPVGVVRHVLAVLAALEAGRIGLTLAPSTRRFLSCLYKRYAPIAAEDADERALVHSCAILLFESLTGRSPLGAVQGPVRVGHLAEEELVALMVRAHEIPAALRGILVRAADPDPGRRYPSLAALRGELEWFALTEQDDALTDEVLALPPRVLMPAVPAVLVDPVMLAARGAEGDLETALVARLDAITAETQALAESTRSGERRSQRPRRAPRRRRREAARVLGVGLVLMAGSATVTAVLMYLAR